MTGLFSMIDDFDEYAFEKKTSFLRNLPKSLKSHKMINFSIQMKKPTFSRNLFLEPNYLRRNHASPPKINFRRTSSILRTNLRFYLRDFTSHNSPNARSSPTQASKIKHNVASRNLGIFRKTGFSFLCFYYHHLDELRKFSTIIPKPEFLQCVQKFVADYLNLVIFEVFGVKCSAKKSIFKIAFPACSSGSFYWAILKNRCFGRKFHSKNLKNDQISEPATNF